MIHPLYALNPYEALGLTGNPFADHGAGVRDQDWMDRGWSQVPMANAGRLVLVLGDQGFGKTSHLLHWRAQTGGPYCYYPPGWRRFKCPPVEPIAYWDEANRIPKFLLLLALALASLRRATIVAGSHCDFSALGSALKLQITTINLPPLDAVTLAQWASVKIKAATLPQHHSHLRLTVEVAQAIVTRTKGSWRLAGHQLHIWAAESAAKAWQGRTEHSED